MFGKTPGDEAAADPDVARAAPFSVNPVAVAIAAAEQTEATGLADRRGQPAAGDEIHGGEQNWVLDAQHLSQAVLNGHRSASRNDRQKNSSAAKTTPFDPAPERV
jgi:hypothetical protein